MGLRTLGDSCQKKKRRGQEGSQGAMGLYLDRSGIFVDSNHEVVTHKALKLVHLLRP